MNRFRKSVTALILASLITLQGTEPIFVQAKEIIEDAQKNAEFSRPEALTEEEAGNQRFHIWGAGSTNTVRREWCND